MAQNRLTINNFAGGINQSVSVENIADNELADAENLLLNARRQPEARPGVTQLQGTGGNRVTSVYHYTDGSGGSVVLFTHSASLFRMPVGGGTVTTITGGLTLPNNTLWQWITFDGVAIGVNRGSGSNANPVKVPDATSNAQALGGSPPKARYIAEWNNRVFLVDNDDPFVLHWSALGNAEDWSTTGKAGAGFRTFFGEYGGEITGIFAQRDRLFIFRRRSIEVLLPGGPTTDTEQWSFITLSNSVGCISAYSIQPLLDDLVFLSSHGVMSLAAVQQFGDFESAVLSTKIPELRGLSQSIDSYTSGVDPERSLYFLAVPSSTSGQDNARVWVYDFKFPDRGPAWMLLTGRAAGASYTTVLDGGRERLYIGGYSAVDRFGDAGVLNDDGVSFLKRATTKEFDAGDLLTRKEWHKVLMSFAVNSPSLTIDVRYFLDGDEARAATFSKTLTGTLGGMLWGEVWNDSIDTFGTLWSGAFSRDTDLVHYLRGAPGRRSQTIGFILENDADEQFALEQLALEVSPLNDRFVKDAA